MINFHRLPAETEGQYKSRIARKLLDNDYPPDKCYMWAGMLWDLHYSPTGPQFPF